MLNLLKRNVQPTDKEMKTKIPPKNLKTWKTFVVKEKWQLVKIWKLRNNDWEKALGMTEYEIIWDKKVPWKVINWCCTTICIDGCSLDVEIVSITPKPYILHGNVLYEKLKYVSEDPFWNLATFVTTEFYAFMNLLIVTLSKICCQSWTWKTLKQSYQTTTLMTMSVRRWKFDAVFSFDKS